MNDRTNDIVKIDKSKWPRTADGTIDWESVFEDETYGLIPAIRMAQKSDSLIDCAAVITEALFAREGDEDIRATFTRDLASIAIDNQDAEVNVMLGHVRTFLRTVKVDRIKRAEDWVKYKALRDTPPVSVTPMKSKSKALIRKNADETELLFEDIFCDLLEQRLQVLWAGVPQKPMNGRKLPFLISTEFSARFINLVRTEFMPIMLPKCRHIVSQGQSKAPDLRDEFLRNQMSDDATRKELWKIWKHAWPLVMQKVALPKKPAPAAKGMLKSLVKAVQSIGDDTPPYTISDWKDDVRTAKMQHSNVAEIWEALTKPSENFEPPLEEDELLLMNMLAVTSGGLRKQIAALRQIAQQSGQTGPAFDKYSTGKELQLSLLAVSHQYPDLFLGKDLLLKDMLRGLQKKTIERRYPLLVRYLGDFI